MLIVWVGCRGGMYIWIWNCDNYGIVLADDVIFHVVF